MPMQRVRDPTMALQLPPPDPHESSGAPAAGFAVPAPMAVYLSGPPSPRTERVSDAILDLRPGALIVLASE
jgi:hypothetical protein